MKRDCLDIGTIQAFLDGELTQLESASVSAHVAACDACALALADAEEESAFVFSALDGELNTLVPTQRLWTRINESIEEQRHRAPVWQKVWGLFSPLLMTPSLAAAAVIVVVFGVSVVVFIDRDADVAPAIAHSPSRPADTRTPQQLAALPGSKIEAAPDLDVPAEREAVPARVYARAEGERASRPSPAVFRTMSGAVRPASAGAAYLPGEESYVKTIATLSRTLGGERGSVMRPSEQVAYARDLALVNDSIERMRREVRKNPKNETARQVLYASYQNKIDLLNSVAQREELVASVK
ncbi:MAG: zf-HC2 domain-containing protein [Pyrinomonadaceae bacterium]